MSAQSAYRPDVDGLRAVAVLSVLVFHAFPKALPGGFAGVDIFFVISGFLITGILLNDLSSNRFSFANFYSRRIRRIFPALALVMLATLAFGWLALTPFDFERLGLHTTTGAAFTSNLLLWKEAGDYFAWGATHKPLLHLWSLGVEEQYYLLWPVLLLLVRGKRLAWLIAFLAIASFAINLYLVEGRPMSAFYLPQARFLELMLGIAWAYATHRRALTVRWRNDLAAVGAILLLASLVLLNEDSAFPGYWALLPTVGTLLLIACGPETPVNRVLAMRPLVFVGLISYPLYLWHWPLLVYARILTHDKPSTPLLVGLLLASFALAALTYGLLEKRVRYRRVVWPLAATVGALGVAGVLVATSVVVSRSAADPLMRQVSVAREDWTAHPNQTLVGEAPGTVIFWGDSLMQHLLPRIKAVMESPERPAHTVMLRTQSGCVPILGIERFSQPCEKFTAATLKEALSSEVHTVVIAGSWIGLLEQDNYYRVSDPSRGRITWPSPAHEWLWESLETSVRTLTQHDKTVVILLSSPHHDAFDPYAMIVHEGLIPRVKVSAPIARSAVAERSRYADEKLRAIARRTGARLFDPADLMCSDRCPALDEQGRFIFRDMMHVRASIARERFAALDEFVYSPLSTALRSLPQAQDPIPTRRGPKPMPSIAVDTVETAHVLSAGAGRKLSGADRAFQPNRLP